MRVIAWILIIVALYCVVLMLTPAEAEDANAWVLCKPGSNVNVHVGPSKGSTVVAYCECGDELITDGKKSGDWVHIVNGWCDHDGWIHKGYVSDSQVVIEPFDGFGYLKARIRNRIGGKMIGTLKKGEAVKVYAYAIGWDGWAVTNKGYVMARYLDDGLGGM